MFTGLIQEVGEIIAAENRGGMRRLTVAARQSSRSLKVGDSIAVSGVCLTAVEIAPGRSFSADLAQETLRRTSFSKIARGARVNLELPMRSGEPLGGHIVQGHIDGVGKLLSLQEVSAAKSKNGSRSRRNQSDWWLRIEVPAELARYIVEKGSITIEGISLTVAKIERNEVSIAIIPHTYSATNLSSLGSGSLLNIEVDVIAKYAEKMIQTKPATNITIERLMKEGF
jgi:riboflavin synthase